MIVVRRTAPAIAVATVALTAPLVAPAQAQETLPTVTVRVLPSQASYSRPLNILENGVVVGNDGSTAAGDPPGVDADPRPWIWLGGRMRPLPIGDADSGFVVDAAGPGLATGTLTRTDPATGTQRQDAVVWRGGAPVAVAPDLTASSRAAGINRRGDVLINAPTPVLIAADGTRTSIDDTYLTFGQTLNDSRDVLFYRIEPGGFASVHHWFRGTAKQLTGRASGRFNIPLCASGVSNSGWVAWSYAPLEGGGPFTQRPTVRRRGGADVALPLPAGATSAQISCASDADAVNERGHAVGGSDVPGPSHALLWRDGTVVDLGVAAGAATSSAVALNDRDDVLVDNKDAAGRRVALTLWRNGRHIPLPLPAGFQEVVGLDLNNRGQVLGMALKRDTSGALTGTRSVVWTIR